MSVHRYPRAKLWPDYAGAGSGVGCSIALLAGLDVTEWAIYALSALGILCAALLGQTVAKHRTRLEVDDDGLCITPGRRRIEWVAMRRLMLSYFSVGKDGEGGWMELRIDAPGARLRVDSRLENFDLLTARAVAVARRLRLELDPTTELNLRALDSSPRAWTSPER